MEEERRLPEHKKGKLSEKDIKRILQLSAILLVIIGVIALVQYMRVREYKGYEVVSKTELYANLTGYRAGNESLLVCGNDGAKAISRNGDIEWEISYQLDNPEVVWCENVAAVADIGGTSVYVVAENGIPYNYEVIYPIVKHEVAKQGVTAVLLDNGMEDYIQLYDMSGTLRVDINTKTKTDGIPIDIALSEDGKKLITLYVTFQGDSMASKVTFYNAGEVGKNYISNIVGQKIYTDNILAYDIGFLNDSTVYVLLENGFALYRMTEVPELICEKTLQEEIVDLVCVENGIYIVKEDAAKKRTMSFYNEVGEEKSIWNDVPEYERLMATEEEVLFFSPQSVTIYRANRSLKFSASFAQGIDAIFPAGNNRYFLVDMNEVQTIKLSVSTNE